MTKLRHDFIRRMEQRGKSPCTIRSYTAAVAACVRFHGKGPLELTGSDIRDFLVHLRKERKLEPVTVNLYYYGLKHFCLLMRPDGAEVLAGLGRMKTPVSLPVILSHAEVERMIAAAVNPRDQALVALLYSSGIRLAECAALTLTDIDSTRMVVRVRRGKGQKDRFALLSPRALHMLRDYYRCYRPAHWLWENLQGRALSRRSIERIVHNTGRRAGLAKRVCPHLLRHAFATHLLEAGVQLQVIQHLLGHAAIRTTTRYTHVSAAFARKVKSPLDAS